MALLRSLGFSLVASFLATLVARRLLSVSGPAGKSEPPDSPYGRTIVVVVPILVGNSNNRIGYVKDLHYSLFRRGQG